MAHRPAGLARRGGRSCVLAVALMVVVAGCSGGDGGPGPVATTTTPASAATTTTAIPTTTTAAATTTTTAVATRTDGWTVSTPEEQGMDSGLLADLVNEMVAVGGFDSVTVVRNGHLVLDTTIYPFPEETDHVLYSVTKSVTATLIGIAIDRGLLTSVDVPIVDVLGDHAPADVSGGKDAITVEHALMMATGLDCRDSSSDEGAFEFFASDDWVAHVLAYPMSGEPGTAFEYCNGASHLLSAIITEVTGESAAEFAADVLFEPLGITEVTWPDADGVTIGFSELALRPTDAAKIGQLYLQDGEWDGRRVVSADWVETAGTAHVNGPVLGMEYGYQWWIGAGGEWVVARGAGGQAVYVIPSLDLVVVFTAGFPPFMAAARPDVMVQQHVLASIRPDPLPPNPDGAARLAAAVEAARRGPDPSPVSLPALARDLDGVRFEFRANDAGLGWFTFTFDDDAARLEIAHQYVTPEFEAYASAIKRLSGLDEVIEGDLGLDGRFVIGEMLGAPTAWRGSWTAEDTFVVEFQMLGLNGEGRGSYEFVFDGDTAQVELRTGDGEVLTTTADRAG